MNHLLDKIKIVYPDQYETVYQLIVIFIRENKMETKAEWVTEEDVMLITYGDSILSEKSPLQTLYSFLSTYVKDSLSAVHLLPMFPYTSDDGFSVVDYMKINPNLGTWDDIKTLSSKYDLMFDAVVNHISKSSEWFEEYKKGNKEYHNFFKEVDLTKDYSQLIRPRALPFYYPYMTKEGSKNIWATFSEDQVDLNYENPLVLIKVLEVLVEYAKRGAKYIRLEAIGFIWKLDQSPSMHLKETHALVQIMREVVDLCVEGTILITETNVPHIDNISYLGREEKEAHMVYQFPLPPLTWYSFVSHDASKLMKWASSLDKTPLKVGTTYFNFLASHDGVGMRPTEGILTDQDRALLVERTKKNNGYIGYKNNSDGTKSPYEMNINYFDALYDAEEPLELNVKKFLAAHVILLSMIGIPAIYIHSLIGSRNDNEGVIESGIKRRINRKKVDYKELQQELESDYIRKTVFKSLCELLQIRKKHKAFSPDSIQQSMRLDDRVFSVVRYNEKTNEKILVLVNVSNEFIVMNTLRNGLNIITNEKVNDIVELNGYEFAWVVLD
jgi:sucrose phosphorylase